MWNVKKEKGGVEEWSDETDGIVLECRPRRFWEIADKICLGL